MFEDAVVTVPVALDEILLNPTFCTVVEMHEEEEEEVAAAAALLL